MDWLSGQVNVYTSVTTRVHTFQWYIHASGRPARATSGSAASAGLREYPQQRVPSNLGEAFQHVINKQITFAVVYKSVNWEVARSDTILSVSEEAGELQPRGAQLSGVAPERCSAAPARFSLLCWGRGPTAWLVATGFCSRESSAWLHFNTFSAKQEASTGC